MVDCALAGVEARPTYIIGWVGCVRVCVAVCTASGVVVVPQVGVGVSPQVSCSAPIVTVGLVDSGWPTWTPGGGVVLVVVVA